MDPSDAAAQPAPAPATAPSTAPAEPAAGPAAAQPPVSQAAAAAAVAAAAAAAAAAGPSAAAAAAPPGMMPLVPGLVPGPGALLPGMPGALLPGAALPGAPGTAVALSPTDTVRLKFAELGASLLFEKVLTSSDANGSGRIVIPKGQAEAHLPPLESQSGTTLMLSDTLGKKHTFKFRFWINNQSRMYLLENTQEVQSRYGLQMGDVLVFGKLADGSYVVMGRKGTKDDTSRKPPAKRPVDVPVLAKESRKQAAAGGRQRQPAESLKAKRVKQKQAVQQVQSSYTYWSGYSLPPRRDGVFRALPNSAAQEGDKVVAQYGCWTAIVNLGGELYQAFFESFDAANAAFEAAKQSVVPPV